jgi:hypothetical protein
MTKLRQFNNHEFRPGTFVVDPAGCGCTDCMMGYSTPADELTLDQIAQAILHGLDNLIDRRNEHEKAEGRAIFPLGIPIDPDWVRLILAVKGRASQ